MEWYKDVICHKSPVAWKRICDPKNVGGLNMVDLGTWN